MPIMPLTVVAEDKPRTIPLFDEKKLDSISDMYVIIHLFYISHTFIFYDIFTIRSSCMYLWFDLSLIFVQRADMILILWKNFQDKHKYIKVIDKQKPLMSRSFEVCFMFSTIIQWKKPIDEGRSAEIQRDKVE